jgi:hypothetical protein
MYDAENYSTRLSRVAYDHHFLRFLKVKVVLIFFFEKVKVELIFFLKKRLQTRFVF